MSLLVVGSMAFDSIKSPFGEVERVIGGSATYFSLAASYLTPVRLVSVVGRDFPKGTLDMLSARKIDLQGLKVADGVTFHWKGYYEYDLNIAHTVKTDLNVFENFAPVLPASYRESRYVFLGNIDPKLQLDILAQVREPKIVALDTMNFWIARSPQLLREVIRSVDIVVINESEIRELAGEFNLVKAARKLMRMGPGRVVIKRGEYGVLHLSDGEIFAAPAYPLETIFDQYSRAEVQELALVLKADVSGSLEAFEDEIAKLPQSDVQVQVISSGVGGMPSRSKYSRRIKIRREAGAAGAS